MSNLLTQENQFVFNLPDGFIPDGYDDKYSDFLKKHSKPYKNLIDYINSNILNIKFPAVSMAVAKQNKQRKEIKWYTAESVYNIFDDDVVIEFNNVDSNMLWVIIFDIIVVGHFLNSTKNYGDDLGITLIDRDRQAICDITFNQILWTGLSDFTLAYNATEISQKTFTLTFNYNFIKINLIPTIHVTGGQLLDTIK